MITLSIKTGIALTALLLPLSVHALSSTSFRLEEGTDDATRGPSVSTSFLMNEEGMTWNQRPLTSTSFQISNTFQSSSSAASTASSSSSSEEAQDQQTGHGRGGVGAAGIPRSYRTIPQPKPDPSRMHLSANRLRMHAEQRRDARLSKPFSRATISILAPIRELIRSLKPLRASAPDIAGIDRGEKLRFMRGWVPIRNYRAKGLRASLSELLSASAPSAMTFSLHLSLILLLLLLLIACIRTADRGHRFFFLLGWKRREEEKDKQKIHKKKVRKIYHRKK